MNSIDRTGMNKNRYAEKSALCFTLSSAQAKELESRPLGDGVKIFSNALEVTFEEYQHLKSGVRQRALALQAFFNDVFLGSGGFLKTENTDLTLAMVEQSLAGVSKSMASVRRAWRNRTKNDIRFSYGPDLVRLEDGCWYVMEDNCGNCSGRGSTYSVLKKFAEVSGQKHLEFSENDLIQAIKYFLNGQSKSFLGLLQEDQGDFLEYKRFEYALSENFVPALDVMKAGEVDFKSISDGKIESLINFNLTSWPKGKKDFIRVFENTSTRFFEAPYVKYVDDKVFLPFVADMIRFYLSEDPILQTLESQEWFDHDGLNERDVLKVTNSFGGDGIYIVDELTKFEKDKLVEKLRSFKQTSPTPHIVRQKRVYPSFLDSNDGVPHQIDMRIIAYGLGWGQIYVSNNPCGRAKPLDQRDTRNNIANGSSFLPIYIKNPCSEASGLEFKKQSTEQVQPQH